MLAKFCYIFFALILVSTYCDYNQDIAIKDWAISQASYCHKEALTTVNPHGCHWFTKFDYQHIRNATVIENDKKELQVFVYENQNVLYVSFRGSDNTPNWIQDFDCFHTSYNKCSHCRVHQGFYKDHQALVESGYVDALLKLKDEYGINDLVIIGHSLGGAIATLALPELEGRFHIQRISTFGSPRVGNEHFVKYWNALNFDDAWRVVHDADIVTHAPFMIQGYHHVNREIWYYDRSNLEHKICNLGEDKKCSLSVHQLSAKDHTTYFNVTSNSISQDYTEQFEQKLEELQKSYEQYEYQIQSELEIQEFK